MSETSLAADSGEQETGIQVDLGSDDPVKSVTRVRQQPRSAPPRKEKDPDDYQRRMSKEMHKRMSRLEANWNQAAAEREAALQRQIADLKKSLEGLKPNQDTSTGDDAAHERAMAELEEKLTEAQERGDSKEVAKLTRQMSSLDAKFWAAKNAKVGVAEKTPPAAATPAAVPQPTKASLAWARAQDWWNDTTDDTSRLARNMATELYNQRLREGSDREDPMLFEEIGAEVKKRFPELTVGSAVKRRKQAPLEDDPDDADGDDELAHPNPRRAAPPSLPNRGDAPTGRRELQKLTAADVKTMREVGMNPDDNKHVVAFLRGKLETAETEA